MPDDSITISPGPRFHAAMALAIVADVLQIAVFPCLSKALCRPPTTSSTSASERR